MATKRQRIMYASQTIRAGGHLLYRVQTLGSNTTFNMEDVFEMGHYDIVDVVDDVPTVAVAIDTNDWGSVDTMAILAGMNPTRLIGQPTSSGAYLRTNSSCTGSGTAYYHGVCLADFNLSDGVKIWAPVQNEASFGSLDDSIQMSLFMDKVYVNSITLTYNSGATATENYAAETDNKMWLVNNGRFISQEEWDIASPTNSQQLFLGIVNAATIPATRNCKNAFLAWTTLGRAGVTVKFATERQGTVYEVAAAAAANVFGYNPANQTLTLPTNAATIFNAPIKVVALYAADRYATLAGNTASPNGAKDSTRVYAKYFELASSNVAPEFAAQHYAEGLGAVRQGQIEIYLIDPLQLAGLINDDAGWVMALRMQSVTVTATPTRTPLNELGHFRPYARPMNFPIDLTVNTTSMASDLDTWATVAGFKTTDYQSGGNKVDIALTHLMAKEDLVLVIKVFQQTDELAGGNGMDRKAMLPGMASTEYYDWNGFGTYPTYDPDTPAHTGSCTNPPRERPLKTIIIPGLKPAAENFNNAVGGGRGAAGGSATQEINFRARNKLFVVKGDCSIQDINCLERNTNALQN